MISPPLINRYGEVKTNSCAEIKDRRFVIGAQNDKNANDVMKISIFINKGTPSYTRFIMNLKISNNTIEENANGFELENILYESISKNNLGAVNSVTDQFTIFSLKGSNIYEVLSKSSPFDFDTLSDNSSAQTLLNNIDVTIVKKSNENMDLLVRRSFSKHLWDWIKDSANLS